MEKAGSQRQPTCTFSPDPSMLTDRLFADSRYHTLPNQRRSVLDKTALLIAICGKYWRGLAAVGAGRSVRPAACFLDECAHRLIKRSYLP
ncbi:hypothetical protein EVAR_9748_1 [Eumeta japonica]|uniref:Uncharacterized protein n=1 Tax=Eumeta variegata TaxID=151549 RepID=A0A4C1U598_EUMVA|nr:hypothetical protein EVAR_9748_1 [Eumeta japonica]